MCNTHRLAPPGAARRLAERIIAVFVEFHEAQVRLFRLRMSADTHMVNSRVPPETYEEFLLRTSGPLRHEPSARARLRQAHG